MFFELLFDKYLKERIELRSSLSDIDFTASQVSKLRTHFKKLLKDPKTYSRFSLENGKINEFVIAYPGHRGAHGKVIKVDFIHTNKIKDELKKISLFYKHKTPLFVMIRADQKKILNEIQKTYGKAVAFNIIARVNLSLKSLSRVRLDDSLCLSLMKLKEREKVMKQQHKVVFEDKTCFVNNSLKGKALKGLREHYDQALKNKASFVIRDGTNIVAGATASINKKLKYGMVGSIWVETKYQNQGLGSVLYKTLLELMKKSGCKKYIGYTSTDQVLHLAKKMKRKIYMHNFIINPELLK
jgi:hypothetical protein